MEEINIRVDSSEYENMRLDKFLAEKIDDLSRSYIQKLINKGYVSINEIKNPGIKPAYNIKLDDVITVKIPEREAGQIEPWDIKLDIIYEDKDIAVINKPAPLVVHPAPSYTGKTLVAALLTNFDNLSLAAGKNRPGIIHRLDKGTTGALAIAKTDKAYYNLKEQFKDRKVKKIYRAVVIGTPQHKNARIEAPIGRDPHNRTKLKVMPEKGKKAISEYKVLESYDGFSLVEIDLKTGRTHQIRVHFSFLGHPILGDEKYQGKGKINIDIKRPLLHAFKLGFEHPVDANWQVFKADLPRDFEKILNYLK